MKRVWPCKTKLQSMALMTAIGRVFKTTFGTWYWVISQDDWTPVWDETLLCCCELRMMCTMLLLPFGHLISCGDIRKIFIIFLLWKLLLWKYGTIQYGVSIWDTVSAALNHKWLTGYIYIWETIELKRIVNLLFGYYSQISYRQWHHWFSKCAHFNWQYCDVLNV